MMICRGRRPRRPAVAIEMAGTARAPSPCHCGLDPQSPKHIDNTGGLRVGARNDRCVARHLPRHLVGDAALGVPAVSIVVAISTATAGRRGRRPLRYLCKLDLRVAGWRGLPG